MKDEIASKLETLRGYVKLLRDYQNCKLEDLENNLTLRGAVERYMELALECTLDIGEMIISAERLRKPETYREIIEILGEKDILSKEFAEEFAPAAGFRNILVHGYADIDLDELYRYLQNNLKDFDKFSMFIARYLEKSEKE
ncbi:MAG: DUF86 domain-containing protein [Candidatus Thermoplasmatota archaeon]|nr:DUF86 domain-containing protein [Candidatus Thermoplasmatota archaeon]